MAYQPVDIGAAPNDGTGDPIRDAFDKCNDNFVELYAGLAGLLDFKGSTDCSTNPNYPASSKGDFYLVSVAGKIGGASGIAVTAGDSYYAIADNAGGTQAAVGTSWTAIEGNLIVDNDTTLAADSATAVPSQHAVKTYVDDEIAGIGSGTIEVQDEGVIETASAIVLNFTGAGVTASDAGAGVCDIDIPGGGAGYTDEQAQDAVGAMVDASLTYVDATPLLQRAALTGDVTATAGSNTTVVQTATPTDGTFDITGAVLASGAVTASGTVKIHSPFHSSNLGVGQSTLGSIAAYNTTAVGTGALSVMTSGGGNTAFGAGAGIAVTTGGENSLFGAFAGYALLGGFYNVLFGSSAGLNVTSGQYNTFIGRNAGNGVTTGSNNTVIGANISGLSATLANTLIIGANSRQDIVHNGTTCTITGALTVTGDVTVPDETYDATAWNGSLEVPTKNAVRDKFETFSRGGFETLDVDYTDGGNVTTTETDLVTKTLDAGELGVNGDRVEAQWSGTFVSSGTATRQLRAYFGGTLIFDTGALTLSTSSAWEIECTVTRVSSSVVRYSVSMTTQGAALAAYTASGEVTGLTLANTQIIKLTGTAAGVGAASDDIVCKSAYAEKHPVTAGALGGTPSGTSFPSSPATDSLFSRTDRRIEYFYDGTRWLSTGPALVLYFTTQGNSGIVPHSTSYSRYQNNPWSGVYDIYLEDGQFVSYNTSTTAANYFTIQFVSYAAGVATNRGAAVSCQNDTINQFVNHSVAIDAVVASTCAAFEATNTETGAANAYLAHTMTYRLVG